MDDGARVVDDRSPLGRFENVVRAQRGWFFALGVGFMLLGILAILLPFAASLVTTLFLGWLMIVGGVLQGFHAVQSRRWRSWGWALAGAVIQVIAGALVVAYPVTGTLTLTLVLAAFFAVHGVVKIVRSIQHRGIPRWGWLLIDGLLSLALGVLILVRWPATAAWALGLLVGIDLLLSGTSMMVLGLAASERERGTTAPAPA